jgi:hypothetical protein
MQRIGAGEWREYHYCVHAGLLLTQHEVDLVDEQDDLPRGVGHLLQQRLQPARKSQLVRYMHMTQGSSTPLPLGLPASPCGYLPQ